MHYMWLCFYRYVTVKSIIKRLMAHITMFTTIENFKLIMCQIDNKFNCTIIVYPWSSGATSPVSHAASRWFYFGLYVLLFMMIIRKEYAYFSLFLLLLHLLISIVRLKMRADNAADDSEIKSVQCNAYQEFLLSALKRTPYREFPFQDSRIKYVNEMTRKPVNYI